MALFMAAYAQKGDDGYYHIIPSMLEECYGITYQFKYNKDIISALCMFRWGLTRTAEAAELLGVDADLSKQWREIAAQIVPYPTWERPEGRVYTQVPGFAPACLATSMTDPRFDPLWFNDPASWLVMIADEINLDSPREQKEQMIRTVRLLPACSTSRTLMLLGVQPEKNSNGYGDDPETLLNSRSGRIYLFPAAEEGVPLAFYHFQARGGFLVTASRNTHDVEYLEIESRRNIDCHLMNPWTGKPVVVRDVTNSRIIPVKTDNTNGECLVFATNAGHKYRIQPKE